LSITGELRLLRGKLSAENEPKFYDEGVFILTHLGLTSVQARVYIALAQSGISTIKSISKVAGVARQDTYRIMHVLQEWGLVERIIANPTTFRAIQTKDAFSILLERRAAETSELQINIKELLKKLKKIDAVTIASQEETQFILIPENETLTLRSKQAMRTVQRSIDITTTWTRFPQVLSLVAKELWEALKRGVKIRFIAEKPECEKSWPEIVQAFTRNPSFTLRYILNPPHTAFGIYDEKEVFITTSTRGYAADYPALWSNNPPLISAMHDLFEIMWFASMEDKHGLIETTPS
jgi:sugar-specific transcriptional regulator TrmB